MKMEGFSVKMNYVTKEFFSLLPNDVKTLCSEFCESMEYEIDIYQYNPIRRITDKEDPPSFGVSLYPSEYSRNKGGPAPISCSIPDFDSLSKSIVEVIDEILERLGETRTSMRMKAQLKGIM